MQFARALPLIFLSLVAVGGESRFFDADGTNLHYVEGGSGDAVVLLHGFGGSAQGLYIEPGTFDALVSAGYRVIALDQRGHGNSEKPHDVASYGLEMVEDVRRLLDHLGVERAHLVGYSMGGKVASKFRASYPERLLTVSLCGYGWPWAARSLSLEQSREMLAGRVLLPGNDLDALAAVNAGMNALTVSADSLRENSVPAFAILGASDEVVPEEDRDTLAATMSNLEMVVIPGTHAGPDGAPYKAVFAEKLIGFLAAH